ncbi:MAG TPA: cytochrome D1 domain-containing protein [Candidatus Sulfotelmatobacter sp.]|nr:cytochrome D1 domain-containing protein [Candidatus Sulfotelmatobacter sp.]
MKLLVAFLTLAFAFEGYLMPNTAAPNPPEEGYLLVANKGTEAMGIIDPSAGRQIAEVAEGGTTGHEIAASPDGRTAYVPIYGNSGVGKPGTDGRNMAVIDLASRKVVGNVDFGKGVRPHCAVFGPKDGMLYVTTELDKAVAVIDPKTLKIVGSVPTGQPESHMLAISPDGKRGYTANVGPGTISVLDMENRKALGVIPVSKEIQRIALSTDGKLIFTSDQTKPQLAVIDSSSREIKNWIPLPGLGYGTAATPDGRWLVVAVRTANKVAVVDLHRMQVAHVIDVPAAPQEVLVRPDGQMAYVSCDASKKVAAIRTSDWGVDKLVDAGPGADGLAWAGR